MAFTIEDFRDLVRILEEKPEWRVELRRLILTEELLALPERVDHSFIELTAAAKRHDEQITGLRQDLVETAKRHDEQITGLRQDLVETAKRHDEQITGLRQDLAETAKRHDEQIAAFRQEVDQKFAAVIVTLEIHGKDIGFLKGLSLERQYADHAPSYFHRIVRRLHKLSSEELAAIIEDGVDAGRITEPEGDDLMAADIVVSGRRPMDHGSVYLVVEVSWGVGKYDVERAVRRARILAKLGTPAMAAVAGEFVTADAAEWARSQGVWQITDGRVIAPESAL